MIFRAEGSRLPALAVLLALVALSPANPTHATPSSDLTAARAVFQANLDAIRDRDREAYLACYLQSESLARTGAAGFRLGYDELARESGQGWPDHFDASDLKLVAVR